MFGPACSEDLPKDTSDTRWAPTWEVVDGARTVKARELAKGFPEPDLSEGLEDTPGYVCLRSPHLQVISPIALKTWKS